MAWCRQAASHYLNQCWTDLCRHMASRCHIELNYLTRDTSFTLHTVLCVVGLSTNAAWFIMLNIQYPSMSDRVLKLNVIAVLLCSVLFCSPGSVLFCSVSVTEFSPKWSQVKCFDCLYFGSAERHELFISWLHSKTCSSRIRNWLSLNCDICGDICVA